MSPRLSTGGQVAWTGGVEDMMITTSLTSHRLQVPGTTSVSLNRTFTGEIVLTAVE